MIKEAVILADGPGDTVEALPNCMTLVAGRPFMAYVIDYLRMQGIEHFIFAPGYKPESIERYLTEHYPTLHYTSITGHETSGTGSAVRLALQKTKYDQVLIANANSLFKINIKELLATHQKNKAECTLTLKPMHHFDRYGVVQVNAKGKIESFKEKQFYKDGLVNGGAYLISKEHFLKRSFPVAFSFEEDYLKAFYKEGRFYGSVQQGYFIDITNPGDVQQAQKDLERSSLDLQAIDRSWTLFLDRDGVINEERVGHYVLHPGEFIFTKGTLDSFKILSERFTKILVVSNQRGVGKQLMTEDDLLQIHEKMQKEIAQAGGHIDKIYYCTDVNDQHQNRKPNPGMALQATLDFPQIDLSKSIMVGNKPGDMKFGRAAGMFTVFVTTTNPQQPFPHPDIDLMFPSLEAFAKALILG